MFKGFTRAALAWCADIPVDQAEEILQRYGGGQPQLSTRAAFNILTLHHHFDATIKMVSGTFLRCYDRRQNTCPCVCHSHGLAIDIVPAMPLEAAIVRLGGAVRARVLGDVRGATARPDLGTIHICWRSARPMPTLSRQGRLDDHAGKS